MSLPPATKLPETSPTPRSRAESAARPPTAPQDHGLPIRPSDLLRILLDDPRLNTEDRRSLEQFARLLDATLHHDYLARLRNLKDLYHPIDPDTDCVSLAGTGDSPSEISADAVADTDAKIDAFLRRFELLLRDANFRRLEPEVIEEAIRQPNELGLNYVPNFKLFDHLEVWVRGETTVDRHVRRARAGFRRRTVTFPAYQRAIVLLKFKPGKHLGNFARADVLYVRLFKDVPYVDMEMHLPEQVIKVRMRVIDKAQIASPVAISLPTALSRGLFQPILWRLFRLGFFSFAIPVNLAVALLFAPVTAGVNSFFGFQRAKQRHLSFMIRQLYYMTQANNLSVIDRLVNAAEEEDLKEILLVYFTLWLGADDPEPWTPERLDATIEDWFQNRLGLTVDFDIRDALGKLRSLGLVTTDEAASPRVYRPSDAWDLLDRRWDSYFRLMPGPGSNAPEPPSSQAY